MPKYVTFTDHTEASDYANRLKEEGYTTRITKYPAVAGVGGNILTPETYQVRIVQIRKGKYISEEKIPEDPTAMLIKREQEATFKGRLKAGTKKSIRQFGVGARKEAIAGGTSVTSGKAFTPVLKHMREKKRMDVVAGMKRAIPVPGGAEHGYLARIGEMKASRIAQDIGEAQPRIASVVQPKIAEISEPRIAQTGRGVGLGVSRDIRYQTAPKAARFQVPTIPKPQMPILREPESIEEVEI